MKLTCLIGEADPFLARLLCRFGEASGMSVVRAKAGQELLDLPREIRPAVIVVEAELPGTVRGWEAIQALRTDGATSNIPVIRCSWRPAADAEASAGDVAGHLQMPELHYDDFIAALERAGVPQRAPRPPLTKRRRPPSNPKRLPDCRGAAPAMTKVALRRLMPRARGYAVGRVVAADERLKSYYEPLDLQRRRKRTSGPQSRAADSEGPVVEPDTESHPNPHIFKEEPCPPGN